MSRDLVVQEGPQGSVVVSARALVTLVRGAAESVSGVRVRRARRAVEVAEGAGRVAVAIEAGIATPLPVTGEDVLSAVAGAVETAVGTRPVVDVTIEAVHA